MVLVVYTVRRNIEVNNSPIIANNLVRLDSQKYFAYS